MGKCLAKTQGIKDKLNQLGELGWCMVDNRDVSVLA